MATSDDDTLTGGAGNDILDGLAGNDLMRGLGGADRLTGGLGADTLYGGGGNDRLLGDLGADALYGGKGSDTLIWTAGDTIGGGAGVDRLKVTEGQGELVLGAHTSSIERIDMTGAGNNRIDGSSLFQRHVSSTNTLRVDGDVGDQWYWTGSWFVGAIKGIGGSTYRVHTLDEKTLLLDTDIATSSAIGVDLGVFLRGDDRDDLLTGEQNDDTLQGGPGNDTL